MYICGYIEGMYLSYSKQHYRYMVLLPYRVVLSVICTYVDISRGCTYHTPNNTICIWYFCHIVLLWVWYVHIWMYRGTSIEVRMPYAYILIHVYLLYSTTLHIRAICVYLSVNTYRWCAYPTTLKICVICVYLSIYTYGVATISRLLKIIGLFYRISSVL